jgi:hypothetical protein
MLFFIMTITADIALLETVSSVFHFEGFTKGMFPC